jgi:hypothetical protein
MRMAERSLSRAWPGRLTAKAEDQMPKNDSRLMSLPQPAPRGYY